MIFSPEETQFFSGIVNETAFAWQLSLLSNKAECSANAFKPNLIVCSNSDEARKISQAIENLDARSRVFLCPSFDELVSSPAAPPPLYYPRKCLFLWQTLCAKPGDIFVITVDELCKKTSGKESFKKQCFSLSENYEVDAEFIQKLKWMGYRESITVEEPGQFSSRGGIFDLYSPAEEYPVRLELFAELVESMRLFDPASQVGLQDHSHQPVRPKSYQIIPSHEALFEPFFGSSPELDLSDAIQQWKNQLAVFDQGGSQDQVALKTRIEDCTSGFQKSLLLPELRFILPLLSKKPGCLPEYFSLPLQVWWYQPLKMQGILSELSNSSFDRLVDPLAVGDPKFYYFSIDELRWPQESSQIRVSGVSESPLDQDQTHDFKTRSVLEYTKPLEGQPGFNHKWSQFVSKKFNDGLAEGYRILIFGHSQSFFTRLRAFCESVGLKIVAPEEKQAAHVTDFMALKPGLYYFERVLPDGFISSLDKTIVLKAQELSGKKSLSPTQIQRQAQRQSANLTKNQKALPIQIPSFRKDRALFFSDLRPGDLVIHEQHGLGVFEGLKKIDLDGISTEFITLKYRDNDRLYVPIYRLDLLHKYSSPTQTALLDRLGGKVWETAKTKARKAIQDLAQELLSLYAKRSQIFREPYLWNTEDFEKFEAEFLYEETPDQLHAIRDVVNDFKGEHPMDRLLCGDVGFGKTEVAMRAAFLAMASGKQVAVICPTTVLCFQHLETFRERFKRWPFKIEGINRFVSIKEQKRILASVKDGSCQMLIGTHRLLSKDIHFQKLGLLIIDEEHKFGVIHKDRIKRLKVEVDSLAMSATPIPRTLNFSLLGIRDFSFINSPPVDRLPVKTAVVPWDMELIKKGIEFEAQRGGQVYFIHNRIQTIYDLYDQLSALFPSMRIRMAHGQMEEGDLEEVMVKFFRREIDILVSTAIVESGVNVLNANTMFIDLPHMLGLAQLYQLRGRVGRTNVKGYCYLLLPKNHQGLDEQVQERLKILQDNTALGSGIRIAQYDLEIRGAGNFLGTEQSGHVESLGYEMYMDLLQETIAQIKGEELSKVEPEVNLKIPAYIPEEYISDVRLRLSFYKALSEIRKPEDLDEIEHELRERFGTLPVEVVNLCGVMLIRLLCKKLGVQDLSVGPKSMSLVFADSTLVKPEVVLKLTQKSHRKYSLAPPGNRLNIRLEKVLEKAQATHTSALGWPHIHQELSELTSVLLN